jgi:hypothetical protein
MDEDHFKLNLSGISQTVCSLKILATTLDLVGGSGLYPRQDPAVTDHSVNASFRRDFEGWGSQPQPKILSKWLNALHRTLTYVTNRTHLTHFSRNISVRTNYALLNTATNTP